MTSDDRLTCVHCGDKYVPEIEEGDEVLQEECFCPYCDIVVNGTKDSQWLPCIRSREDRQRIRKGFHEV